MRVTRGPRPSAHLVLLLVVAMGGKARAELTEESNVVSAGVGFGALVLDDGTVAADHRLRLAVGVGEATAELRLGWAPQALRPVEPGAPFRDLVHASMGFGFRLYGYRGFALQPLVSLSLEMMATSTESGRTALGFGLSGLVGVEIEIVPGPQRPGECRALIFGLEVEVHRRLASQPGFAHPEQTALSFGGYGKWRF